MSKYDKKESQAKSEKNSTKHRSQRGRYLGERDLPKAERTFPWSPVIFSVLCVIAGIYAWINWGILYPFFQILAAMQSANFNFDFSNPSSLPSGTDLAALQSFQSTDVWSIAISAIWFVVTLTLFVEFLVRSIVNWIRWGRGKPSL